MDATPSAATVPSQQADASSPGNSANAVASGSATEKPQSSQAASSAKLRKRTKTGCLTCRKRRIKCGEERPICNNCIKSKRQCEGYNPRVIWKPPIGDWPGHNNIASTLPYHTGVIPGARPAFQQQRQPGLQHAGPNAPIQPRPMGPAFDFANLASGQIPALGQPQSPAMSVQHGGYSYVDHGPPGGFVDASGMPPAMQPNVVQGSFQQDHSHQQHPGFMYDAEQQYHPSHSEYQQPQNFQQSIVVSQSAPQELSPQDVQQSFAQNLSPQEQQQLHTSFHHQHHQHQHHQHQNQQPQPDTVFQSVVSPSHPSFGQQSQQVSPQEEFVPASNNPPQNEALHLGYSAPFVPQGSVDYEGTSPTKTEPQPATPQIASKPYPTLEAQHYQNVPDAKYIAEQVVVGPPTQSPVDMKAWEAQLMTSQFVRNQFTTTDMLYDAAVEVWDDDYFDVESDEDIDISPEEIILRNPRHQEDLSLIMRLYHQHTNEVAMRRIDAFVFDGILDHYHAEWSANPLRNERTARVFAHFIHATGPMLSVHERNPLNTTAMFSKGPVPPSQQSLWTYTLPMMALHNQGLLHAMLALGSLHIARLQRASITPSLKHYAYALKRIHHSVGTPEKRHQVTTLAATLLLGFYELMTADHVKWSTHLVGAKQLLVEIDYGSLTKVAKAMKAEQAEYDKNVQYFDPTLPIPPRPYEGVFKTAHDMPDERVVSTLLGRKLHYDERGHIIEDFEQGWQKGPIPPTVDMSKYEVFQDLYWWYCRQDAYQSIVSGNKLLMDFERWGDCPPRASIGKADAIFATHDHFLLLVGRVTDFATRDRDRKIRLMETQGGAWRPSAHLMNFMRSAAGQSQQGRLPPSGGGPSGGRPPGGPNMQLPLRSPGSPFPPNAGQHPLAQGFPPGGGGGGGGGGPPGGAPPQMPTFYGMSPSAGGKAYMPASYAKFRQKSPEQGEEKLPLDLEAATQAALDEWKQVMAAVEVFGSNLGPGFQQLSAEYHQPLSTPFGDARQYRSYEISILWALYYMAKIITIRSHPAMPPAAMMAAGVAAPLTAEMANEIGRITAGVALPPSNVRLNPSVGAALISSTLPLFFAGVQYTDSEQRSWLVTRLLAIEARTGFGSAGLIARGCETAWEKMALSGRGPPYTMTKREADINIKLSGRVEQESDDEGGQSRGFGDRRFIFNNGARLHFAMGLLAEGKDLRPDYSTGT